MKNFGPYINETFHPLANAFAIRNRIYGMIEKKRIQVYDNRIEKWIDVDKVDNGNNINKDGIHGRDNEGNQRFTPWKNCTNVRENKNISEYNTLPHGFEGFGFDDAETKPSKPSSADEKVMHGIKRGAILKIGNVKWKAFKDADSFSVYIYKYGTKARKYYNAVVAGNGDGTVEIWQAGGHGQNIGSSPIMNGKLTKIGQELDEDILDEGTTVWRGWITDKGIAIPVLKFEEHSDTAKDLVNSHGIRISKNEDPMEVLYKEGWISVGDANRNNAIGLKLGLSGSPAVRELRKKVSDINADTFDVFNSKTGKYFQIDANLFAKHGVLRDPETRQVINFNESVLNEDENVDVLIANLLPTGKYNTKKYSIEVFLDDKFLHMPGKRWFLPDLWKALDMAKKVKDVRKRDKIEATLNSYLRSM
jgi:hypothetical protein